jgi:Spy/CpxP family protein refolding chaperone
MTEPMRWRMFAYMAALFIAGAVTGAAVMARTGAAQTLKVGRTGEISAMIWQRLSLLDLSSEQETKFKPVIQKASEELEASHMQCLERSAAAVDSLHAQIKLDLTPEQLATLAQLEAQRRATMKSKYNYPP